MTRGKYRNSAEARRARESAIAEATALRREIRRVRQQAELDRAALQHKVDTLAESNEALRQQLRASTSDEVARLRDAVAAAQNRLRDRNHEIARGMARLMDTSDFGGGTTRFWAALLEILDVEPVDMFGHLTSRVGRRSKTQRLRQIDSATNANVYKPNGLRR